jgi:hypothetical protein
MNAWGAVSYSGYPITNCRRKNGLESHHLADTTVVIVSSKNSQQKLKLESGSNRGTGQLDSHSASTQATSSNFAVETPGGPSLARCP